MANVKRNVEEELQKYQAFEEIIDNELSQRAVGVMSDEEIDKIDSRAEIVKGLIVVRKLLARRYNEAVDAGIGSEPDKVIICSDMIVRMLEQNWDEMDESVINFVEEVIDGDTLILQLDYLRKKRKRLFELRDLITE